MNTFNQQGRIQLISWVTENTFMMLQNIEISFILLKFQNNHNNTRSDNTEKYHDLHKNIKQHTCWSYKIKTSVG